MSDEKNRVKIISWHCPFKERRPGEEKGSRRIKKSLTRLRSATNSMVRKRISREEPLIVTKPISCFLGFLLEILKSEQVLKKDCPYFFNWATHLKMSLELTVSNIIQYLLASNLSGNPLRNICYFLKFSEGCQNPLIFVGPPANILLHLTNLPEHC